MLWKEPKEFKEIVTETFELSGAIEFVPVLKPFGLNNIEKRLAILHKKRDKFLQRLIEDHSKVKDESTSDQGCPNAFTKWRGSWAPQNDIAIIAVETRGKWLLGWVSSARLDVLPMTGSGGYSLDRTTVAKSSSCLFFLDGIRLLIRIKWLLLRGGFYCMDDVGWLLARSVMAAAAWTSVGSLSA
ncbi:unnamed protein product [Dovyalis caffra]|uniref:Uncharacterized protein n=1 Tax=Dovyalis caffra TaxID=77055 RepID=A0AAV1RD37_9ROSI|nr:unnamed protein product [Dovyalis caffra]